MTNNVKVPPQSSTTYSSIKLLVFEIIIYVGAFYYIALFSDTIAKYTGYPLATFAVPAIFSSVFALVFGKILKIKGKKLTLFILVTAFVSIAPTTIFIGMVNLMSGPF